MKKRSSLSFLLALLMVFSLFFIMPNTAKAANYGISVQYYSYNSTQNITVYYSGASTKDWIGIYKEDATPSSASGNGALAWKYAVGSTGSVTFTPNDFITATYSPEKGLPLRPGKYKAILFQNDGYTKIAGPAYFEIAGDKPLYTFEVVSDAQVTSYDSSLNNNLALALNDMKSYAKNSSCIVMNGDTVDQCDWDTYAKLRDIVNANGSGLPYIYFNVGNHEFAESSADPDLSYMSYEDKLNRFLYFSDNIQYHMFNNTNPNISHTKQSTSNFEQTVYGNHFLFLGNDSLQPKELRDQANISNGQSDWVYNRLWNIAKYEADQPVFVFLHQSLSDTVAGSYSYQGWGGIIQDSELKYRLNRFPNVIYFSGHSHWQLKSPNTMFQAGESYFGQPLGATMFQSSSIGYTWNDNGYVGGSEGLHVEVYRDKVIVRGRDFINKCWIPEAQFTVDMNAKYNSLHNCTY